jgi:co-chaperonin GroES (HSP10)|tara:strand:+ start:148 stop:405 length:258 start_codon:yes stop_codon:yes gene_type:complete
MNMKMIGSNILVTETEKENTTSGGIILTGDTSKGAKPALVLMVGPEATHIKKGTAVFLDWTKAMPVDVEGNAAAIIDMEHIKAVM